MGSAIECRVYAEDPDNQFLPSPGKITFLEQPSGPGVRLDSGVYQGWTVPLDYDPMLAKMAVWAPSRELAIERMRRALREFVVCGIRTNIAWFDEILSHPDFRSGALSTAFLDRFERVKRGEADIEMEAVAAVVASLSMSTPASLQTQSAPAPPTASGKGSRHSAWRDAVRGEMMR
jgi:acetyl-CoA carboxylase biotin carboxylase subunit